MAEQRLIDANALIEDLEYDVEIDCRMLDDMDFVGDERKYVQDDKDSKQYVIQILQNAPTIEERKTGKWCVTPSGELVCSNCYENPTNRVIVNGSLIYDMTPIRKKMRYCPNCGADMRGEEDETD